MGDLANPLTGTVRLEEYHFTPPSSAYLNGNTKRMLDGVGAVIG